MGLEATSNINGLILTNPVGSSDTKAQGDDHIRLLKSVLQTTFPGFTGVYNEILSKGTTYTLVKNDNCKTLIVSGTPWTLGLTAAATLGDGWRTLVINQTGDNLTIDPDGSEQINGNTTLVLYPGQAAFIVCSGTDFKALIAQGRVMGAHSVAGTVDAITAVFHPKIHALYDKCRVTVRAAGANTISTPTFAPDGLTAKTIVKANLAALSPGDIVGAGFVMDLEFNASADKWVLVNAFTSKPPAKDHGTKAADYTLYLDEAEFHTIAFSASVNLTIASRNTNDKATIAIKNGGFTITLVGIDAGGPTLTIATGKQDFLGMVKSFSKMICVSYVLNQAAV